MDGWTHESYAQKLEAQISDMMTLLQDHCDLLSEQPADSKRPFIIGARTRLAAFIERWNVRTGPTVMRDSI